jgi:ADP-ribose pyrophosphatase YjhB (NUDIX family)
MRKKVLAVIIKDNKILLMRRVKNGRKFFVFPGGRIKIKENLELAVKRAIKQEFDIEIKIETFLFRLENKGRTEFYFLAKGYQGEPKISGEKRQIIDENNQYYLEWKNLSTLKKLSNLHPNEAKNRIEKLMFSLAVK